MAERLIAESLGFLPGSPLGWALGAAVGAYIGNGLTNKTGVRKKHELVVAIVGDGSYLLEYRVQHIGWLGSIIRCVAFQLNLPPFFTSLPFSHCSE